MKHSETRRIIPGAKNAVLFLHGIVGSPNHFRQVLPLEKLIPEDWSLINVCYPGHGGTVRDFGKSGMDQWRDHAIAAFLKLAEEHEKLFVVGHSMGTLFAMQLALEFPEKTAGLFLLNVPMRPWMRPACMKNCLRLAFNRIREDHHLEASFKKACGLTTTPLLWRYIPWIPRILELFVEIRGTEKTMGHLNVPCVAWQSRKDDLVRNRSASVLRKIGVMEVHELPDSTHFYYAPGDQMRLCEAFENEIKKISG